MTDTNREAVKRVETFCQVAEIRRDGGYATDVVMNLNGYFLHASDLRALLLAVRDEAQHSDDIAVDQFAAAMKAKLKDARENKGRSGWDDPKRCSDLFLASALLRHAYKSNAGTFEDIANFAMMLHQRGADPAIMKEANVAFDAEFRNEARDEALEEAVHRIDSFLGCARIGMSEYIKGQDETAAYLRSEIRALKSTCNGEGQ